MRPSHWKLSLLALAATLPACDSTESSADDHTPASYQLLINDVVQSAPVSLTASQTVRVRLKFFNAANEDLDDVEGEHYALLSFSPTALATIAAVAGHHYQFDVTGGTAGTGTLTISFGHDAEADEKSFPAIAVTVSP